MTSIQVYDPALCCNTGVCGVEVDQALVGFAADAEWAKQIGLQIERFNLAQQPLAFAENPVVKAFLERSGQEGLPLILVDDQQILAGRYPTRDELMAWSGASTADSIFTEQVAELVAISAAIAANCEPCFKHHYDIARKLGVSHPDMRRAVDLAQKVKDSPARAMLQLASRFLDKDVEAKATPAAAASGGGCTPKAATEATEKTSPCCGPKSTASNPPKSSCC